MKINLTYKEANLLNAILWELTEEQGIVHGEGVWRLSDSGDDIRRTIAGKLDDANEALNRNRDKYRDLSGCPKGTIEAARWSA